MFRWHGPRSTYPEWVTGSGKTIYDVRDEIQHKNFPIYMLIVHALAFCILLGRELLLLARFTLQIALYALHDLNCHTSMCMSTFLGYQ